MKTLAYLEIPKMFDVFSNSLGYDSGYHEVQYYCTECHQLFIAAWGRASTMGYAERGWRYHCPHCGSFYDQDKAGFGAKGEKIPHRVSFLVRERKDGVDLEIRFRAYTFRGRFDLLETERKEVFRFDVKKREALWWRQGLSRVNQEPETSLSLGNPLDFTLFEQSIAGHFNASSQIERSGLTNVIRTLREAVEAKMADRYGRQMESTWVSYGDHGYLLLPLVNLAFRTVFPDAPNLPDQYRSSPSSTKQVLAARLLTDVELIERAMAVSRTGADYVTAFLQAAGIPNSDSARRCIRAPWWHNLGVLKAAYGICENIDLAIRLFNAIENVPKNDGYRCRYPGKWIESLAKLSGKLKPVYGTRGIVRLVEGSERYYLADCLNLLDQVEDANLHLRGVRIRDLHDWLTKQQWLQDHKNLQFNVPEHIIRRMAMQTEKLKFFLPKESMDLFHAGKSLHNCVGSYGKAVADQQKWIVLVADDKGKLTACLEIRENKLVQAKLDSNAAVSKNPALNAEVVAWAKAAGITIKTNDVKVIAGITQELTAAAAV